MWFVRSGSRITGPFTEGQLLAMRRLGEFSPIHQVSIDRVRWESAAQLVAKLDGALPDWRIRTQPNPHPASRPSEWYYMERDRQTKGPVPEQMLRELLQTRRLARGTLACRVGETNWDRVDRLAEFAQFAPSNSGMILTLAGITALSVGALAAFLILKPSGSTAIDPATPAVGTAGKDAASKDVGTRPADAKVITSLEDQKRIDEGVGFVVCGWSIRQKNGKVEEIQISSGSCFAITLDGYLVTNRHVIEDVVPRKRMQPDFRIKDYCDYKKAPIITIVKKLEEEKKPFNIEAVKEFLARFDPANYQSVEPRIWIFFGSKDEQYDAEVVHTSPLDMALLKINRKNSPYFRLADTTGLPKLRAEVYALGFPGAALKAVSKDEQFLRDLQKAKTSRGFRTSS